MLLAYARRCRSSECGGGFRFALDDLGQTKVKDLCLPALGHKNVSWLDVTENDPLGMRRLQRVGNLNS